MVELLLYSPQREIFALQIFLRKEWSKNRRHEILQNVDFYHHSSVGVSTYLEKKTDGGKLSLLI